MRRPILLLIIMAASFSQSDIGSPNVLSGVIYPLLFAAATLTLLLWLIHRSRKPHRDGSNGKSVDGGSTYSGKNADSGDAGGDGGGD